jgi:anti-sigma factor RsiW
MSNDPSHPNSAPSAEQFAAFLDGQLEPAAHTRVEAWLTTDPAAAAEMDGQRRVARLWVKTVSPEPDSAAWTATFARIEAKLSPRPSRSRLPRTLWLGVGAVAACLAAVVLTRHFLPAGPTDARQIDPPGNVVAAPSGQEEFLLASQEDVSIMNVEPYPNDDGLTASIGEGEVPMIVAPRIAPASGREP